jgi:vacuolar iron transporter family protein
MKNSIKTGIGFGVTSGVMTTLGSLIGLYSGTLSKFATIGGILIISISDAFSDSMGIHMAKELEKDSTFKDVWVATLTTFFTKFFVGLSFIVPILILPLNIAVKVCVFWGFLLLSVFGFYIAKTKHAKPWRVIIEYLFIISVVIVLAQFTGIWIRKLFLLD